MAQDVGMVWKCCGVFPSSLVGFLGFHPYMHLPVFIQKTFLWLVYLWLDTLLVSQARLSLGRGESLQAFVLHTQQPNKVGVPCKHKLGRVLQRQVFRYYALLSKQHAKKGNRAPSFVTSPNNTPRIFWHVRIEMMMGDSLPAWESGPRD